MTDHFQEQLIDALPSMKAFAMTLCRNRTRAEDLVQDVACRALAKSDLFEPGTNFKAWVFTIMRNHYIDTIRQQKREALVDNVDDMLENLRVTPPNQEHRLVLKDLMNAMGGLTRDQREVLTLVVANGFSYEDAAAVCKCPVGTIRSRLARARRDLEQALMAEPKSKTRAPVTPRRINRELAA
jgi:RNA polymerase sigma-70 factor (ECF subfamily)